MSKKTQLHSTESKQTKNHHDYFDFTSLTQPYGIDRTDDPYIGTIMMSEAVMKFFHPDEYETMKKLTRPPSTTASTTTAAIKEEEEEKEEKDEKKEEEDDERNQVHHTVSKIYLSKYNSNLIVYFCRLIQIDIHQRNKIVDDQEDQ